MKEITEFLDKTDIVERSLAMLKFGHEEMKHTPERIMATILANCLLKFLSVPIDPSRN